MKILTERRGPVLIVTLDRPKAHNAFDAEMIRTLQGIFADVAAREPREVEPADETTARPHAVLLRSSGPTFCAGADLVEMRRLGGAGRDENLAAAREMGAMFAAIRDCPAPVVARVQGPAFGGGVGLACACDIVVADPAARFTFSEVRLGLVAGVISPFVIARTGPAAARHHFLTGDSVGAETARRIGMVDRLAAEGGLDGVVRATLRALLKGGPQALARTKELVAGAAAGGDDPLEFTAGMIAAARAGDEAQAALKAFFDDRRPAPWAEAAERWEP